MNFYLDVSAIGNEYQAYADTPTTWGVPQDGNGKAGPGHSAAVAIATIDVAGCAASGTGTISVLGVTVSSTLNASGSALATAIAAAINASTTATTATYSALLLPLNRLVYARVNPALNTQVQIMLRIAGADWVGYSPTQANISPAATISNFAGGANGPFAYLAAATSVFGKSANNAYGLLVAKSPAVSDPGASDAVIVRSSRSGSSLAVSLTLTASISLVCPVARNFVTDHGAVWSGDDGVFSLSFSGNYSVYLYGVSNLPLSLTGGKKNGWSISFSSTNNSALVFGPSSSYTSYSIALSNIDLIEANSTSRIYFTWRDGTVARLAATGCRFQLKASHALSTGGDYDRYGAYFAFIACEFVWSGIGTNVSGIVDLNATSVRYSIWSFSGCIFTVDSGAFGVVNPCNSASAFTSAGVVVSFENCVGVTALSAGMSASTTVIANFLWDGSTSAKEFRFETPQYATDWTADGSLPVLDAETQSGDAFSTRILWRSVGPVHWRPARVAKYSAFYRDASGIKTITLEMLTNTSKVPNAAEVFVVAKYTDTDGVQRVQRTGQGHAEWCAALGTALSASSAAWTLNGAAGVEARKISVTTDYPMMINTEVVVELYISEPAPVDQYIYASPLLKFS